MFPFWPTNKKELSSNLIEFPACLHSLNELILCNNDLDTVPVSVCCLNSIVTLDISGYVIQ